MVAIRFQSGTTSYIPTHFFSFAMDWLPSSIYTKEGPEENDNYFNDLDKGWYEDVGLTIIIATVTLVTTPMIAILVQKLMNKIKNKKLKKVKIHIEAKKLCKKPLFELSKKYA
jgi:hypothetical protein